MLHLQKFICGPLNVLPDLVTVSRSIEKGPQDEHVKRSLEKTGPLLCLLRHRRHSTLNLATMVDTRLSAVLTGQATISYCTMENAFKRDLRNYPLYFLLSGMAGPF